MTFLFTDIEGSTLRWQDDPEAMRVLLAEHDEVLRRLVEKHRGHVFKHTGDGVAAVFASASDAAAAAVDATVFGDTGLRSGGRREGPAGLGGLPSRR